MADIQHLEYPLEENGYIHNWLLAGPQVIPVPDLASFAGQGDELRASVARHYHKDFFDLYEPPLEWATFQLEGVDLEWRYGKCREDHLLDLSATCGACHYLRSWAYVDLIVPAAQAAEFVLTANGPADVWINRQHAYGGGLEHGQDPESVSFPVELVEGGNEILVRFEATALRTCPYAMALQVLGIAPQDVTVQLPVQHTNLYRRLKLERVYGQAYLEHLVVTGSEGICFTWDTELEEEDDISFWVRDAQQHIKISGLAETVPGRRTSLGGQQAIFEQGPYDLVLLPPPHVIQQHDVRYNESLPFYILETPFSDAYYGTDDLRRREALDYAARREGDLYAQIARLALGRWGIVDAEIVRQAVDRIDRHQDGSQIDLLGLLGMVSRYPDSWTFDADLKEAVRDCALGFRYWYDEPGQDVMAFDSASYAILFHTCEILAGQLYPDDVFTNAGQSGRWHGEKGERLALDWLHDKGEKGFVEWDSHGGFADVLLALSHLADLAEDEAVAELAAVVMDKIFFTMAVNSFKGTFGSTHGRTEAPMIKSAQLEATSGIMRLMWGMGVWNEHIRCLVSLACSKYELPTMIASIAVDLDQEMWHREHHPGVDKVTYRTPDTMLCSAQDYRPGEKGDREHIWQATLGPDAVVFANHPSCVSEDDAQPANFWRGNAVLPRVAQWKDVLIAVHNLSQQDAGENRSGMGFTHAYFPVYEFDEYAIEDGWAFARKGSGYLALMSSAGFKLVHRGPAAFRELRAAGSEQVWVCMMGRETVDGTFEQFKSAVKALHLDFDRLDVRLETLRGQTLSFGWTGELMVDGKVQPLSGSKHYDGPHCVAEWPATQMDVHYGDYAVRLWFD